MNSTRAHWLLSNFFWLSILFRTQFFSRFFIPKFFSQEPRETLVRVLDLEILEKYPLFIKPSVMVPREKRYSWRVRV